MSFCPYSAKKYLLEPFPTTHSASTPQTTAAYSPQNPCLSEFSTKPSLASHLCCQGRSWELQRRNAHMSAQPMVNHIEAQSCTPLRSMRRLMHVVATWVKPVPTHGLAHICAVHCAALLCPCDTFLRLHSLGASTQFSCTCTHLYPDSKLLTSQSAKILVFPLSKKLTIWAFSYSPSWIKSSVYRSMISVSFG